MNMLLDNFRKTVKPQKGALLQSNGADTGSTCCSMLHYYITVYLLFGCFLLVSSHQHFGNPIHCFMESKSEDLVIPESVMNSYCFVSTTYSVLAPPYPKANSSRRTYHAYPGVQPDIGDDSVRRHAYYQWVPLVLLLQIILFMIPHWMWKGCEAGLVGRLVSSLDEDLERRLPMLDRPPSIELVANYFYRRLGYNNQLLGFMWIICDLLALLNVICNFYLTDSLLGATFLNYGLDALRRLSADREVGSGAVPDMSTAFFPVLTKCSIHTYGVSGSVQKIDSICLMSLNIVNEKVFLLLWAWYFILAHLTVLGILVKFVRVAVLKYGGSRYWQSTIGVPTRIKGGDLPRCAALMSFGDCVLFHLMAKNMRPLTYRAFVKRLALQVGHKNGNNKRL